MAQKPRLLNVGCGATFHPDWTNLDARAVAAAVMAWDIRRGLPFPDHSFDACYSSHVLEHLEPAEGLRLLHEMYRVVRPEGIVRVVVPDLELIVRDYLHTLERAAREGRDTDDDYDWMMIQLLDQSVRRSSGGTMAQFWRDPARGNVNFVVARAGLEAEGVIAAARNVRDRSRRSLFARIQSRSRLELLTEARRRLARTLVRVVAGKDAALAFDEGQFRNSGEIHQWMYDRYSLTRALRAAAFASVEVCSADSSRIADFARYELDVVQGRTRKPDSLFMEGSKKVTSAVLELGRGSRAAERASAVSS